MEERKTASAEVLRELARYDISVADFIGKREAEFAEADFRDIVGRYDMKLNDILEACRNLKEKKADAQQLADWLELLTHTMSENFGLNKLDIHAAKNYIPENDRALLACIFSLLESLEIQTEDDKIPEYDNVADAVNDYIYREDHPDDFTHITNWQIDDYLRTYAQAEDQIRVPHEETPRFLKMVNVGCSREIFFALYLKAYGCYGGDDIFPCDWKESEKCLKKLFEKTADPHYANTLGFLYYYGRVSDGKPEYNKAFQYFVIGALHNIYESCYMVADMMNTGTGTIKSEETAENIITRVYPGSKLKFMTGNMDSSFADIAYRMGCIEEKRALLANESKAFFEESAYSYFIQAEYAINTKMEKLVQFGDQSTKDKIEKEIARVKKEIPDSYFNSMIRDDYLNRFMEFMEGYNAYITFRRIGTDEMELKMKIRSKSTPMPQRKLLVIPEFQIAALTDTFICKLKNIEYLNCIYASGEEFKIDEVSEESDGSWKYFCKNKLEAEFKIRKCEIYKDDFLKAK